MIFLCRLKNISSKKLPEKSWKIRKYIEMIHFSNYIYFFSCNNFLRIYFQILSTARVLTGLCKSVSPTEINDLFTESEISAIAKMSLAFLGAMGPLFHSMVLLKASSEIVSIFIKELPVEWTDKENMQAVYKAINSLEILCIQLRNDVTIAHPTVTGNFPNIIVASILNTIL